MKKIHSQRIFTRTALIALLIAVATPAFAQDSRPAEEKPNLPWMLDIEKAKATAKAEGKDIFINFTGSDWCGWCKRLDAEVFEHAHEMHPHG